MEPLFNPSSFTGYVYPNETIIPWTLLIVVYPYLTGLVAGAFTISSLYQVFGFRQLRPVAHFAMKDQAAGTIYVSGTYGSQRGH